jgi:REP element-mobilizing transposase RayT
MARAMKYHPHRGVFFVTFSVEEGLLFLCNPLCSLIIRGCLARAHYLYRVKVCHILVEASHVHLILVTENPSDLPAFIRHFKTETAHLINRILGRRKRTIWCEGYDSPIVLSPLRALIAIVYLYSNPAKDGLEESIESYPGFSSWKMFQTGAHKKLWSRIPRDVARTLPKDSHSLRAYMAEAKRLESISQEKFEFLLEPNAWMEAFGINDPIEQKRLNVRIYDRLRALEARYKEKRIREGKRVLGRSRLISQVFDLSYRPERSGRKMWCLSEDRRIRLQFIEFFKNLMARARTISRQWKLGDFSHSYPLGLYPPSMPKLAEPIATW